MEQKKIFFVKTFDFFLHKRANKNLKHFNLIDLIDLFAFSTEKKNVTKK